MSSSAPDPPAEDTSAVAGSSGAAGSEAADPGAAGSETAARQPPGNMLPGRERRRFIGERLLTRLVATCGIVGIGVAIAAIMVSSKSQGWLVGLVVAVVSVVLSAILWSSRQL